VIRQRADFPTHTEQAMARLPPELQRLIGLAPVSRDCFILRVLFGISPVNCAAILNLSSEEFKESLCAAYQQLPALGDKTCSPVGLARSGGITTTPTLPGNR
jgi:DNA-directed RNA polymerase specialized sigma24 family protein